METTAKIQRFNVLAHDLRITKLPGRDYSVYEKYNSACLLGNGSDFLTLLARSRTGIPESLILDIPDFRSSALSEVLFEFNYRNSGGWDSLLKEYTDFLPQTALKETIKSINSFLREPADGFCSYIKNHTIIDLIGSGPGLTPAGDDYIIGILNTSSFFTPLLFKELAGRIASHINNTTSLSRNFIRLALEKRASEDIIKLLFSIAESSSEKIKKYTEKVASFGETSGYYTLKGILWVLKKI
ncbi:DUF2877 domain-containing protein [Elusimicrobiota bacterium]